MKEENIPERNYIAFQSFYVKQEVLLEDIQSLILSNLQEYCKYFIKFWGKNYFHISHKT